MVASYHLRKLGAPRASRLFAFPLAPRVLWQAISLVRVSMLSLYYNSSHGCQVREPMSVRLRFSRGHDTVQYDRYHAVA